MAWERQYSYPWHGSNDHHRDDLLRVPKTPGAQRADIKLVSTFLLHVHVNVMCLPCFVLLDWIVLSGGE